MIQICSYWAEMAEISSFDPEYLEACTSEWRNQKLPGIKIYNMPENLHDYPIDLFELDSSFAPSQAEVLQ